MGDVLLEKPMAIVPPHKLGIADSMPEIDSIEGAGLDGDDEYSTMKRLQRHLEFVHSGLSSRSADGFQVHQAARRVHQR
jgi:hypothetical protein